jgi:hypothetical protein
MTTNQSDTDKPKFKIPETSIRYTNMRGEVISDVVIEQSVDTETPQAGLRLTKNWSDLEADYYYTLEQWTPYDPEHICYVCHDDWKRSRRKCPCNGPRWTRIRHGDLQWAERQAKHYDIDVQPSDPKPSTGTAEAQS